MKILLKDDILPTVQENSRIWLQILAALTATLLAIGSGIQHGWPAPSVPKMVSGDLGFEISEEEASYIVMIAPLGYLIGSPLTGILLDKIGRKYTLLFLAVPQIISCLLIANANNVVILYVTRVITGATDGALFAALPIYMCEILEPKVRGVLGTSHSLGMLSGQFLINAYGSYVSIRTAAYITLCLPLLFLLTFSWMPESPYYLLMKARSEDARKSLKRLRRMHDVDNELSNITSDVQRQISEPGTLRDIFTIESNLKAFLVLLGLRTFQQFSGYSSLTFYLQVIFKEAEGALTPVTSAIVCSGIQVVVLIGGSFLVDRFGRKPMFIFSTISSGSILMSIGLYFIFQQYGFDMSCFLWLPLVGMILYNLICAIGVVMIPTLMGGELLSASIKSKALGIISMYLGVCMSVSSKLFQWLEHDFGMCVPFFFFAICCLAGAVFCYMGVPETKGKTLEEIQQLLKGNRELKSRPKNEAVCKTNINT